MLYAVPALGRPPRAAAVVSAVLAAVLLASCADETPTSVTPRSIRPLADLTTGISVSISQVDGGGGNAGVGAMNLLNFFNTFSGCTNGVGGAATDCRGASDGAEFDRQWRKTVAAIVALNADVLGIVEMKNDGYGPGSAIADLVSAVIEQGRALARAARSLERDGRGRGTENRERGTGNGSPTASVPCSPFPVPAGRVTPFTLRAIAGAFSDGSPERLLARAVVSGVVKELSTARRRATIGVQRTWRAS